jgi:hypothetical protein
MSRILGVNLVLDLTLTLACSMNTSIRASYKIPHNTKEEDCTYENAPGNETKECKILFREAQKVIKSFGPEILAIMYLSILCFRDRDPSSPSVPKTQPTTQPSFVPGWEYHRNLVACRIFTHRFGNRFKEMQLVLYP